MHIITRNQISIEFIIESDILFADQSKTLVQHYLIKEEKRASHQIKLL